MQVVARLSVNSDGIGNVFVASLEGGVIPWVSCGMKAGSAAAGTIPAGQVRIAEDKHVAVAAGSRLAGRVRAMAMLRDARSASVGQKLPDRGPDSNQ